MRSAFLYSIVVFFLWLGVTGNVCSGDESEMRFNTDDGMYRHPIMKPDPATFRKWVESYKNAPKAVINEKIMKRGFSTSVDLLSHMDYMPSERDQGTCGNCWVWAGTGCMEAAHSVEDGVFDRLSVQYCNSNYSGGTGSDYACCGGWLSDFADFYRPIGFAVPWSNTSANWQDGGTSCGGSTTVSGGTIGTTPQYGITYIDEVRITTQGVTQATAIANIKSALNNDQAVWFGFFLSNFNPFFTFWNTQNETAVWDFDGHCGGSYDFGINPGGHAVLCVGYNDDDPSNSYWIMVNSWGTTAGRPNGIFRVDMDMDYSCSFTDLNAENNGYALYWQTLDVDFDSDSCEGRCGGMAPSGCYCDELCHSWGDCCEDKCWYCYTDLCDSCEFNGEPLCGGSSYGWCYCDEYCHTAGDCCDDKCDICPSDLCDEDGDGVPDDVDNCLYTPNGPAGGTCSAGTIGAPCMSHGNCGCGGYCSMDQEDVDEDGYGDVCDNCPSTPNGPEGGTCSEGTIGDPCMSHGNCGCEGYCSMNQEDTDEDDIGDVCDGCDLASKFELVDNPSVGDEYYTDRSYTITGDPWPFLSYNEKMIKLPNDDKNRTDAADYLKFNMPFNGWVNIFFDSRLTSLPSWASGWSWTPVQIYTSDAAQPHMQMYERYFYAGECVNLGANKAPGASSESASNYVVLLNDPTQNP